MVNSARKENRAALNGTFPVMRGNDIRLAFNGTVVLDGIDLAIHRGSVILLRGANGAGKTCLIDILTGVLEPTAGTVRLFRDGQQLCLKFPTPAWRRMLRVRQSKPDLLARFGAGRSWQDIRLFEGLDAADNLRVAIRAQAGESLWSVIARHQRVRKEEQEVSQRANSLLARLGLSECTELPADSLSFGQARRLAVGRALSADPSVLFLDEPLAGLDRAGIAEVMELIRNVAANENVALVIVEHTFNIPWILDVATEVWTLSNGKLAVEWPEAVRKQHSSATMGKTLEWLDWLAGPRAHLSMIPLPKEASLCIATPRGQEPGSDLLKAQDLLVRRGRRVVIGSELETGGSDVSFKLRGGQVGILMAPNGWGKTTLISALAGVLPLASGAINASGGRALHRLPPWKRVSAGLTTLQSNSNSFDGLTVREALRVAGVGGSLLVPAPLLDRRVSSLSGGERQLVSIDAALRDGRFDVALMDEPFQSLDHATIRRVCTRLRELSSERAVLLAVPKPIGTSNDQECQETDT